jgi:TfoX/Sxy family transcriptional regulator of competence genes
MAERVPEADAVFRDILASYAASAGVTAKRMFGSTALLVDGKMAAFVDGRGRLVTKLPPPALDRLQGADVGEPMVMRGRSMRAWWAVPLDADADWSGLVAEAVEYVHTLASPDDVE